jgi:hypothetical protein
VLLYEAHVSRCYSDPTLPYPGDKVTFGKVEQESVWPAPRCHQTRRQLSLPFNARLVCQIGKDGDCLLVRGIPAQIEGATGSNMVFDQGSLGGKWAGSIPGEDIVAQALNVPLTRFGASFLWRKGEETLHPKCRRPLKTRDLCFNAVLNPRRQGVPANKPGANELSEDARQRLVCDQVGSRLKTRTHS